MLTEFHPAVAEWFGEALGEPTECQRQAWPAIRTGCHTLIAAPTGSGKTLAAFLNSIDELIRIGLAGALTDETRVLYVSPLKALGNDIQKNLDAPLAGIRDRLLESGLPDVDIRTFVRSGDTPAHARQMMRRRPPHILVTTPESLYILLTSRSGRDALATVRTVIVDEIHAVAGSKRGAHLLLSLERLAALAAQPPLRIGLSATQRPIERMARFLTGGGDEATAPDCTIVDLGHVRDRDLAIELPRSPLTAVMSAEVWGEVYDRLAEFVRAHHTTLVFVNTRRLAERLTRHLGERLGEAQVAAHHGSLSREHRHSAEQRLKAGDLKTMVATASLELGIDIGDVDLVCQMGSTRSIGTFLQRAGRAGHGVGRLPKARLFPLSRDELIECLSLLEAVRRGELDRLIVPERPLDVLAQQIAAEVAMRDWAEGELFELVRRAWPWRSLPRAEFDAVVAMLAEGYAGRRGRTGAWLHRDAVHGMLRARRGARLVAVTAGGAIPDNADFEVRQEPAANFIGTVNEDFAIESMAGDIFQLGNASWRILRVESGTVRVEDAHGAPPTIPFWLGEAPARSHELSAAVARLREDFERCVGQAGAADCAARARALAWLASMPGVPEAAATQAVDYLAAARAALGCLPTGRTLIVERFFDESGGMQLVIHSPAGGRLNRAFGLALRKCFCRRFNFELQAAATEDAIVLSLGETHSFPLADLWHFVKRATVRDVLTQALLDAPMFKVRWRWNVNVSLAVPRFRGGRKVPPRLQRMQADDLAAVVFPDSLACFENITGGRREIPDHPLVRQTIGDCLTEAMDIDALEALLGEIENGRIRLVECDLTEPSPLASEVLNARPYAFLDDAPLEERRTQAVASRRWLDAENAADLGRLDPEAIAAVRSEMWPEVTNVEELHDALLALGAMTADEIAAGGWQSLIADLAGQRRAGELTHASGSRLWVAVERLPMLRAIHPDATGGEDLLVPVEFARCAWTAEAALIELLRGRLQGLGPLTAAALAMPLGVGAHAVLQALAALEAEGFVLRGRYTGGAGDPQADPEWCERRVLARIHRRTVNRLRAEIAPVPLATYLRFLLAWQHVGADQRLGGEQAAAAILEQLEGFPVDAAAWEQEVLPARIDDYSRDQIDRLCLSGRWSWLRLTAADSPQAPLRTTPVAFVGRRRLAPWQRLVQAHDRGVELAANPRTVLDFLRQRGPSFAEDIGEGTGLLRAQIEEALAGLVVAGRVSADGFDGLRQLLRVNDRPRGRARLDYAGRWLVLPDVVGAADDADLECLCRVLLRRYGVICRRLLDREPWLPPWRDLLRNYRRLEARGEVRGGRFLEGIPGEHFALPEAVAALRAAHREPPTGAMIAVSGCDPLNLSGILVPGPRLPAVAGCRLLYRDGVAIAWFKGGEVSIDPAIAAGEHWQVKNALIRRPVSGRPQGMLSAGR